MDHCSNMLRIVLFCSLVVGCLAKPRIVGGTDAAEGEFPYIVSLRVFKGHNCGGSILDESHILTAAHCVYGFNVRFLDVQYGLLHITTDDPTNAIPVETATMHPEYVPNGNYANDVAVLKLAWPIPLSELAVPTVLPDQNGHVPQDSNAVLIGWGYPYTGGDIVPDLQKVNITLFSYEYCEQAHGANFDRRYHVCAGVPEGGKGQCSGDSGGPLTVDGVQYGTVSWSIKPCTVEGYPGVFANVANYVDWILEQTK